MRRLRLACLALLLAAGPAGAESPSYRVERLPEGAAVGETARLVLLVSGLSPAGLELVEPELDEGLALESWSLRPRVSAGSGTAPGERSSELLLDLRVLSPGRHQVGEFLIRGKEGRLLVASISFSTRALGAAAEPASAWRWSAPAIVLRYEAFELRLEPRGGGPVPAEATASFPPPPGLSLETSGPLSWTALALEPGELELPPAFVLSGSKELGRAAADFLRVRPLPAPLAASKAIGRFELRLEAPSSASLDAGRTNRFALILEGRGNQPLLELPAPQASLGGERLQPEAVALRRIDHSRPRGGAFEGQLLLELLVTPPREGLFELSFEPLPVLEPGGALSSLRVPVFSAELGPAPATFPGQAKAGQPGRFDRAMENAAASLAAELPGLAFLPASLAEALREPGPAARKAGLEALLGLHEGQSPKLRRDPRLLLLEAGLSWELGERGRGLSLLYGLLRREPGSPELKELAAACSGELGSGPPLLDSLPSPTVFEAVGAVALLGAVALFLASRRSPRPLRAAAACLLGLSLAAAGLSLASAGQRRRSFVLLWTDRLLPVPSPLAEGALPLAKGSTAELRGRSSGYVGVTLAQGLSGWAREADVYYY